MRELQHAFQSGDSVLIEDLWNAPKALVAAMAQRATGKHVLILTGASQEEVRLFHDFAFFTDMPVLDFPAWETLPTEDIAPSPDIVGERYHALRKLSTTKQPYIVLSSLQACLQKLIVPENFEELYEHFVKGTKYPFDEVIEKLVRMGYQKSPIVSDKGQFAVRGGIIDIFPVSSPDPYRLEFWEDDLESLRIFDPIGQKSVRQVDSVEVTPAQELELVRKDSNLGTILDYLGPNTIVIYDDLLALEDRYSSLVNMSGTRPKSFCTIEEFLDAVAPFQRIFWSQQPIEELSDVRLDKGSRGNFYSTSAPMQAMEFDMFQRKFQAKRWVAPFMTIGEYLFPHVEDNNQLTGQEILEGLGKLRHRDEATGTGAPKGDVHLQILCASELDEATFNKRIREANIALPRHTSFKIGYLSNGIAFTDIPVVLMPLTEITKRYKIRRQKLRSTYHTTPAETYDLSPGEMVVHYNHGIGRYLGLEKRLNHNGVPSEFFQIEYADHAKLYVPLNQAYLLTKYIGTSEEVPSVHTLGENRWKKKREHAEKAILQYASELLDLYARRELTGGFVFGEDSPDMAAFEEDFPFVETEDQLEAISCIKKDMMSVKSMDRLICGDVGYGKTEVAMRAAFKAVVDGHKQVAVLVPTTVLAMQHYENFTDRFSNFPVTIGVLSRFRTAKQVRETIEGVKNGSVDVVIGTHRIISDDVQFKDLGLIVIDEEQRFGVKAKDHLKRIKAGVDCLTLSATPIPRTLYMSLVGARDMSVISTPPQDRLPITTVITEPNDVVIKNALLRELARDGQAYIIHNRVESIFEYASHIQSLLPQARVAVAHGQMHSDEIDLVFHSFKSGKADILVATTIVENGIDIPNANTIIIDRADRFGMAELYQLRGRVGRWNRRAYAYFFVPRQLSLPEIVRKRLEALAGSSGYGGGMKVAMQDLEIRGAGNILGLEQSGQVSSIGFHLYCKLLKRAMLAMQGKAPTIVADTKVEFLVDARISEEYVAEASLRMEIYQRFGEAISLEEVDAVWEEVKDRFGPPPEVAIWLYHLTRIRAFAAQRGFVLLKQDKFSLVLEKQQGKQTATKRVVFQWPKKPKEVEDKIISILKEEF